MTKLIAYTQADLLELTSIREGEVKLGQRLATLDHIDQLSAHPASFVLLGLPEDVGIRANYGKKGASQTWRSALKAFCNVQSTEKLPAENILVLGHLDFSEEMAAAEKADIQDLRRLVESIDRAVYELLSQIFAADKVPILVGGGHNNAYPILKALSHTHQKGVNTVNLDAHADFRTLEGRHSGNGFSYAFAQSHLDKYAVCGLHENYNSQYLVDQFKAHPDRIFYTFFEDFLSQKTTFESAFKQALDFTKGVCGLEIDLDAIAGVPASAATPSGFSPEQIRRAIYETHSTKMAYLHLCEAIAEENSPTAKLIAYLISDFVKVQA
jgi:formiminoglutamase